MSKVIITGCSGQDGSYMAEYLLANTEHFIVGTMRRTSQPILKNLGNFINNPRFRLESMDLNDSHSITSLIQRESPDYIINFGASTFVPDSWNQPALVMQTNAISLIHILEAVRTYCPYCRVYSSGSSEMWGDVIKSPQNEDTEMRPCSLYGVSKCAAGMICKTYRESYGLYVIHGILLNHESPRRQEYFVTQKICKGLSRICKAINDGQSFEPIKLGNLQARRDWSHALDFIEGIWMMMNQELYNKNFNISSCSDISLSKKVFAKNLKSYVLSSDETHSIKDFINRAIKIANISASWVGEGLNQELVLNNYLFDTNDIKSSVLVKVDKEFYRPNDVELLHGDSSAARKDLGWKPKISFDNLVKDMLYSAFNEVGINPTSIANLKKT